MEGLGEWLMLNKKKAFSLVVGAIFCLTVLVGGCKTSNWLTPSHGEFYTFVYKTGEDLPAGQIIARKGQKGSSRELHTQGWLFWVNTPWNWCEAEGPHKVTEVPPNQLYVLVQQDGKPLPEGKILAPVRRDESGRAILNEFGLPESDYKGVLDEYLGPGQYRIHPHLYKMLEAKSDAADDGIGLEAGTDIPAGTMGVLTRLDGIPLPQGQFIAPIKRDAGGKPLLVDGIPQSDFKGILEEVLPPGFYRIHPKLYKCLLVKAQEVRAGDSGIVTALNGDQMPEGQLLAKDGQRGVWQRALPAGMYYLNPYMYRVESFSVQSQLAEFLHDRGRDGFSEIDFPSKDGFTIKVDVAVEWRVMASRAAEVFVRLGNIKDIERKVIVLNTRGIARVDGSKYGARDFIQGEGREKFEKAFVDELTKVCAEKGIEILRGLIRKIDVPEEISVPIKAAEVARQEVLRNQEETIRARSAAGKAEEEAKIRQRQEQIRADTEKLVAETEARRRLSVAEVDLQTAEKEAQARVSLGNAEAIVIFAKKKAEADGIRIMTEAFGGGESYARFRFAEGIAANTTFVWLPSNEGTFWGGGGKDGMMDELMKWLVKSQRAQVRPPAAPAVSAPK